MIGLRYLEVDDCVYAILDVCTVNPLLLITAFASPSKSRQITSKKIVIGDRR
jgi:hypothetical protein